MAALGDTVLYALSAADVTNFLADRADDGFADRIARVRPGKTTGLTKQGNPMQAGDVLPMVVTKIFPNQYGFGKDGLNGQLLLDGNDSEWIQQAPPSSKPSPVDPGTWTPKP